MDKYRYEIKSYGYDIYEVKTSNRIIMQDIDLSTGLGLPYTDEAKKLADAEAECALWNASTGA